MLIQKINYEEYLKFTKELNQQDIFHSMEWAKFREKSGWNYEFVSLKDENKNVVAAALILTKSLPKLKKKFAHIPRGFIIDYSLESIVTTFTKELKEYLKKQNVFAFRIDPSIKLHTMDRQKNIISGEENTQLVNNLKEIGYVHQGYVDNFEGMFPRLTFINHLQNQTLEQMYDELYYKTRTNIQTAKDKGIEIQYSNVSEIDDFLTLLREKASRDGILGQSKEYFVNLLETLNEVKQNSARLCFTFLNTQKYLNSTKEIYNAINKEYLDLENKKKEENISAKRLKKLNNMQKNLKPKLDKAQKEIDEAQNAYNQYPNGLRLTGSIYVVHENRAWFLFTGSSEKFRQTMPAYLNLWEMIKTLKEEGIEYLDLFGASGDISKESPYFGIYLFKNRFNGEFVEYIGEFDYVINKFYYFIYKKIAPKLQTSKDSKTLRLLLRIVKK